ncbi:MAG: T9SS type A sorting domain-containing protein, partial [Bacteroidia bacterium]
LTTTAVQVVATMIPSDCATAAIKSYNELNNVVKVYPNPFTNFIKIENLSADKYELRIYNVVGTEVIKTITNNSITTLETSLPSGIYFYKIILNNQILQSGKLIAE